MTEPYYDALVVGGGHAGAHAAAMLRHSGFSGSIAIICEEPFLPYERPPLSKEYLSGEKPFERMLFNSAQRWADLKISILLGCRATGVESSRRRVTLGDGNSIGYGDLVWAGGGAPRRLTCPGVDLLGVHSVRTRADVDEIRMVVSSAGRAVVVGGGYIGLEAAAALIKLGIEVVIIEAEDRVLSRVAGEPLSRFFEAEHRAQGVDVRLKASVQCIEGEQGRVSGVRIAEGRLIAAELIIVGIGIEPVIGPLAAAGAVCGNGVRVDEYCRTSLPNIYAVGDCAEHRNRFAASEWVRLESVQNANDQAAVAARCIAGQPAPYECVPWFWSTQYDLRLQTVGLSAAHDEIVVRGDPADRKFSLVYLREGRVIALDCVNMIRDYTQGRALVLQQTRADRVRLAQPSTPLKALV